MKNQTKKYCTSSPWCEEDQVCRCDSYALMESQSRKGRLAITIKRVATVLIILVVSVAGLAVSSNYTNSLFSDHVCADHETQTLYECNK